jgi:uncharacterized protein DUF6174
MISPNRHPDAETNGDGAPASPPVRGNSSRWKTAVAVMVAVAAIAVSGIMKIRSAAVPELTDAALEAAEKLWDTNGPASYDMEIEIGGVQAGTVQIEVRNKEVTAMQRDGITPKQRRTWDVWSVPGMFEMIERELQLAADPEHEMQAASGTKLRLLCEFDPKLGYPRQFQRIVYGGGPDVFWRTVKFEPK